DPAAGWHHEDREVISSALSYGFDVTKASVLRVNAKSDGCFQGQTHGHKGFLIKSDEAETLIRAKPAMADVLFPFLIAKDFLARKDSLPSRYVIDFGDRDV